MPSNHHLLKIKAFEVDLPKSFSMKVAKPIAKAKSKIKILINFIEERNFITRFIISEFYTAKLLIFIKFVIKLNEMKNIILIGSGNVATHLGINLKNNNFNIVQVISSTLKNAETLATKLDSDFSNNISELKKADLIIVAVSDNEIGNVANQIINTPIVHTSGSVGLEVFKNNNNAGVFYPLQTFNTNVEVVFKEVPICIEANNKDFEKEIIKLAQNISDNVVKMDSKKRKQLHIAAVFSCNFTNQMFAISDHILENSNIDFKLLLPIIKQTVNNLKTKKAIEVQTGPAIRKDMYVIQEHINLIQQKDIKELYQKISNNIIQTHE